MNRLTMAILVGASIAAFGCSRQEQAAAEKTTTADVRKEVREASETTARYVEQERAEFVRKAQEELDRLGDQLAQIKSQAQAATGEAKARLDAQAAELDGRWKAAEARLDELKATGAEKWREAKASFTQQLDELKQSFEQGRQERKQG